MRLRLALSLTALLPIAAACSSQEAPTAEPTTAAPATPAAQGASATEASAAPELNPPRAGRRRSRAPTML
jgi:hypothetical protein